MPKVPNELKPYWPYRDELSEENGIIFKGDRIVMPKALHQDALQRIHAGHQGSTKCKDRARTCVFWENINEDIDSMVRKCQICTEFSSSQSAQPLQNHEIPTRPWQVIGTDLFHLDGKDFLLMTDYYSKFPFVRRLPINMTSNTVVGIVK